MGRPVRHEVRAACRRLTNTGWAPSGLPRLDRWLAEVPQPGGSATCAVSPLLNECRGRRGQRRRHKRPADSAVGIVTRRAETPERRLGGALRHRARPPESASRAGPPRYRCHAWICDGQERQRSPRMTSAVGRHCRTVARHRRGNGRGGHTRRKISRGSGQRRRSWPPTMGSLQFVLSLATPHPRHRPRPTPQAGISGRAGRKAKGGTLLEPGSPRSLGSNATFDVDAGSRQGPSPVWDETPKAARSRGSVARAIGPGPTEAEGRGREPPTCERFERLHLIGE